MLTPNNLVQRNCPIAYIHLYNKNLPQTHVNYPVFHFRFVFAHYHSILYTSRKHAYIISTHLNPTFIQKNWGLQGYTLFFLFLLRNIDCGYSLEPPRRGGSNEYPQSMFWAEIWKISELFIWLFSFFGGKIFSIFE